MNLSVIAASSFMTERGEQVLIDFFTPKILILEIWHQLGSMAMSTLGRWSLITLRTKTTCD